MTVSSVQLYKILEKRIGGDEAQALAEYVHEEVQEQLENSKTVLATKEDMRNLLLSTKEDMQNLLLSTKEDNKTLELQMTQFATKKDFQKLEVQLAQFATKDDLQKLELKVSGNINGLEVKMAQFEARITRWMFIFWAGQIGVLIAVLKLFFKN